MRPPEDTIYLIPDAERIASARWAAIELLYPALVRHTPAALSSQHWHHAYDSAGGIHSERPPE